MTGKVADSLNNLPIGKVKAADLIQSDIKSDPAIPVKLPIEAFKPAYQGKGYNEPSTAEMGLQADSPAMEWKTE